MPTNIEIKARVVDLGALEQAVATLGATGPEILVQEDTFFAAPRGRLKLRRLAPDRGELILYFRAEGTDPRPSDYTLAPTTDPGALLHILTATLPVLGVVRKTRRLYLASQTRIHLDEVEGLGSFMELEVVLRKDQTDNDGAAIARELMQRLGIARADLLDRTYLELLQEKAGG
jgi:predicted adenylyl cyclase CyaB